MDLTCKGARMGQALVKGNFKVGLRPGLGDIWCGCHGPVASRSRPYSVFKAEQGRSAAKSGTRDSCPLCAQRRPPLSCWLLRIHVVHPCSSVVYPCGSRRRTRPSRRRAVVSAVVVLFLPWFYLHTHLSSKVPGSNSGATWSYQGSTRCLTSDVWHTVSLLTSHVSRLTSLVS